MLLLYCSHLAAAFHLQPAHLSGYRSTVASAAFSDRHRAAAVASVTTTSVLCRRTTCIVSAAGSPDDATPLDGTEEMARKITSLIAAQLDAEWGEQDDHVRVGSEAGRFYCEARATGTVDIGQLLIAIVRVPCALLPPTRPTLTLAHSLAGHGHADSRPRRLLCWLLGCCQHGERRSHERELRSRLWQRLQLPKPTAPGQHRLTAPRVATLCRYLSSTILCCMFPLGQPRTVLRLVAVTRVLCDQKPCNRTHKSYNVVRDSTCATPRGASA